MKFPILNTENLTLRQIFAKDINIVFEGLSNRDVTQFMTIHYSTLKETGIQMNFYEANWKSKKGIYWAIELKTNCKRPQTSAE